MKHGTVSGNYCGERITLQQINKTKAKLFFDKGKEIFFSPCNMRVFNAFHTLTSFKKNNIIDFDFSKLVDHYEYYNCNNKEVGTYTSFFIKTS